ncbi:hypothetical protein ACGBZE_028840, partial [Klebsiella pneumoniae]
MAFNPELGSTSPAVLLDNAERLDKLVNGPKLTEPDRAGVELDTWRGMMAKNDEVRQNLIPLSRQYMTLDAAQADIANIPVNSTTYVRSQDGSALADEYINNAGTLTATGRKMPSQQAVDDIEEQARQAIDWLQRLYLGQQSQTTAISDTANKSNANEAMLQRMYLAQQSQTTAISDTANKSNANEAMLQRMYLAQQSQTTAISDTANKSNANEATLQRLHLAQQLHAATLSGVDSQLAYLSQENLLSRLMVIQKLAIALSALDGFDPEDSATASPPLLDTHFVFGEPAGIIRISVDSPNGVPPNKDAGQYPTTARLDVDGKVISFYSTLEVQGATSAFFPKKNLNITFSSTADRDEDMDLKIGDIIPHDEWTFKANWIDNTHSRQYASFLLWSQMMDS